ncbi:MAG: hypothetical protein A3C84_04920 [Candidatus Ryanbacteria bacterium RIFCSPHIGHO2_02_FULL_48_12]|uniref:MalT-like TPR region domain-containing protein n=1 Tax=Candidatus Ryanbacteria bacterium RIFCSPHIGHO2_01_FULL_48_27 TaxID=1802115 RepID=A0A1G2G8F0_9BACT|nr:MAG: hypothetical protein A2756_06205 [Candidatus Ryanbacteria bacterium RIFCSPHIGHO2_01_FULL_48_27]OGZ49511.1 MAG: hypothetical protein A3C84_04920 [Candidatus Ryanbacteria bacterium RIFCSPHIGHO2_02_FULL_48_12]
MYSTREKVWQRDLQGFQEQLTQARDLEQEGRCIEAYCLFATAYYSHYASQIKRHPIRAFLEFCQAKRYAELAFEESFSQQVILSHSKCDVIATILLRRWLWQKANPTRAGLLLDVGLAKADLPPHSHALMTMGLAEAHYLLGNKEGCVAKVEEALAHEASLETEQDQVQAHRQFCRVLRRAFTLYFKLGHVDKASGCFQKALEYAADQRWKSEDQHKKLLWERAVLRLPAFVQWLLPH